MPKHQTNLHVFTVLRREMPHERNLEETINYSSKNMLERRLIQELFFGRSQTFC